MNKNYYYDLNSLGEAIRTKRKEIGMTQTEVAESIGICMQHYSRIERGIYIPSLQTFLALSCILNLDIRQIRRING